MIKMNDIYYKIGSKLASYDFDNKNVDDKKELVDEELKNYVIEKISELGYSNAINSSHKNDVSLNDLVEVLGATIPFENHFDTLRHLTHFIINKAGEIQGRSIIWWSDNNPSCIGCPVATFDENGYWDNVSTHKTESYVNCFEFTYDVFVNQFMKKGKVNKKIAKSNNSEV